MSDKIIDAVARLPHVMENINLPFQAGNDEVLRNMKRGYTNAQYRELISKVRSTVPEVAIVTDLIVGFPGETEEQFEDSVQLIQDLRFDKVHVAMYSTRPNTFAQRKMVDDVTQEEKHRRLKVIEATQETILSEINASYFGSVEEILVDGHNKGRWQGRTRTDKLVFFESEDAELGQLRKVRITKTTPWSLSGSLLTANP